MKSKLSILALILAFVFMAIGNAFAVPILQLYIEGSIYDSTTETWTTQSSSFTLWAIGNVDGNGGKGRIDNVRLAAAFAANETGTITLTPTTTTRITDPSTPSTPVLITTIPVKDGSKPKLGDGNNLPSAGIYGEGTWWNEYSLGNFTLIDSPIADFTGGYPDSFGSAAGQINAYRVEITGGYSSVHFDLYDHYYNNQGAKYIFAPFSHDAESGGSPVPEPATMTLLGLGLVGLLGLKRKK